MKFKINNQEWKIEEIEQSKIKEILSARAKENLDEEPQLGEYFGITFSGLQKIYIDKNLPLETKRKTLIHELTHCYIGTHITHLIKNYSEEEVCDIVANSNHIINEIVRKYFKNVDGN